MKKRKFSKVIAVALAALMVIGMVPMMAFAGDMQVSVSHDVSDAEYYSTSIKVDNSDVDSGRSFKGFMNFEYQNVDKDGKITVLKDHPIEIVMSDGAGWSSEEASDSLGWWVEGKYYEDDGTPKDQYSIQLAYDSDKDSDTGLPHNAAWTATLNDDENTAFDINGFQQKYKKDSGVLGTINGLEGAAGSTITSTLSLEDGIAEPGEYTLTFSYNFEVKENIGSSNSSIGGASWKEMGSFENTDTITIEVIDCHHENAEIVYAKEPTCGADGNIKHVYCPDCGTCWVENTDEATKDDEPYVETTEEDVTLAATGEHRWNDSKETEYVANTCTEDGAYATKTCKDCKNTYYYVLGENEEYVDGETELILVVDDNYVIPSLGGHKYGAADVKMAATCTERGYQEFTCTECGYTYGEEVGALGHSYDYSADTSYFTWSEDHTSCTITAVCSRDESHPTESKDCTVTIEKTPATWEEDGSIVYTAQYNTTGSSIRPNYVTDTYTEIIPMFGDNAEMLDGGLVKVVEDENVSIKTNTPEYGTFSVTANALDLMDITFEGVVATDDVNISFDYTGLNEDGTISVAEDATEVSFGIENFTYDYSVSATVSGTQIGDEVLPLLETLGVDLGDNAATILTLVPSFDFTADVVGIKPVYTVTATDADGKVYYFDVTYDEENEGNATFTCENIPAGDYIVTVGYTYDMMFSYDSVYTGIDELLNNFLVKTIMQGLVTAGTIDQDTFDLIYSMDLTFPVSDTDASARSISSSDEFDLALEKTIGAEDIIIEVEELEGGLLKTRTGADVSFVGGADDFVSFDVVAPVMGLIDIPFNGVTAADDLSISFNYSGLNETGTLTVAEDADVATFGIENFTYDYSALATITSTAIGDAVADLLGDPTIMGVLGSFLDEDTMDAINDYLPMLGLVLKDLVINSDGTALTATYTVYATAADGTVYPFSVVYDGNNATFTCYNIPAGEYDVTVDYAFDISFDYDVVYTSVTDLLAMLNVDFSLDIPVSGTAKARVIESSDSIPTTVLADIENEDVPSAGGESGSGESGESGSGESGETEETCEHEFYIVASQAATCEDEGWVLYACSICGLEYTDYSKALGHDYVDGVCTRCGAIDPDYVAPSDDTDTDDVDTDDDSFTEADETEEAEDEEEDEFTEVEDEDEFTVVEDESSLSPQTGASLAAIGAAMAFAAAGIVVVTRRKKEED